MKIVIAPDKFKGSLTGFEYCDAVEEGIRMVYPNAEILKKPLADGGDGTIAVVKHYIGGERVELTVNDPLFRPLKTAYIFSKTKEVAFIEMAEVSGLKLLTKQERNCVHTTSLGFGELIVDAINKGTKELILGIGGSATNDGGIGVAQALGYRFLDAGGKELKAVGGNLIQLKTIETDKVHPKLNDVQVKVACDVSNPLYGPHGAAYIYGGQKGASPKEIEELNRGLENYAKVIQETFGINVQNFKGGGAAGGMGAGCKIFLNAELLSGIDLIIDIADFDAALENTDWIITGEGQLDSQTLSGKTISGVLKSAKKRTIPVAALCGSVVASKEELLDFNLSYVDAVSKDCKNLDEAISNAYQNLVKATERFARSIR